MPQAVRFDHYGGVDALYLAQVPELEALAGRVVVRVVSAGLNPGEIPIREGLLDERYPTTFPSGQGSDFAGVVTAVGAGVSNVVPNDFVLGWSDERAAQASYVSVPADHLALKPADVSWHQAGALAVAGFTALALRKAAAASSGDTVVLAGASGGVGALTVQLLVADGVHVIGLASAAHHDFLRDFGADPLDYHDEHLAERIRSRAPNGVAALLDAHGGGYVELGVELGLPRDRVVTIIDYEAAQKLGTATTGQVTEQSAENLAYLAERVAAGELVVPVEYVIPIDQVQDAYRRLAEGHTAGKIVLTVSVP
jgi:NADPH:quinone reductase-like Zn-dependent oxidoreductase